MKTIRTIKIILLVATFVWAISMLAIAIANFVTPCAITIE